MREPRNIYEKALWEVLREGGWELLRSGWPDIIAIKDDRVAVFEVKAKRSYRLKDEQLKCMDYLSRAGVECYRWDKDAGFLPYSERMPDVRDLNALKKRRQRRKEKRTCPICGKEKRLNATICWDCEHNPRMRYQITQWEIKRQGEKEKELNETANRAGLPD